MALNGHGGTVAWALGSTAAGVGLTWVGMVQLVQEPLVRDLAALSRRLDDTVQQAIEWRVDARTQVAVAIAETGRQAEERRVRMETRQGELNVGFATAIGEVTARFNRMVEERERLLGEAFATRRQILEHIAAIDKRLVAVEEESSELNCSPGGVCYGPR